MEIQYWERDLECLERSDLEARQLERLRFTLAQALKTPFYRRRLAGIGLRHAGDVTSLDDIRHLPYTTKSDLREAYPDGLLAVPLEEVVRIHTSSGTTGAPTVIYHTLADLEQWTDLAARSLVAVGMTRRDVFQNMMGYGLFTGGLGMHYGAERLGALTIPSSSGNTPRQIGLMRDFKTTVVHATPSYLLHLHGKLAEIEPRPDGLALKKALIGAEACSENTRRKIEQLFGIDAYNSYGLSEMNGPAVAFECVYKQDMHIWEDAYYVEMAAPGEDRALPEEVEGELVLTTLRRHATPLLRYRTGDLTMLRGQPCACGRTHRRIARIKGRTDDMLIINGVNVYPSQIEQVLMKVPEVGTNYLIEIAKEGALDRVTLKTEIYAKLFTGDVRALDELKRCIGERIKSAVLVNPRVELHEPGSLPVTEGKAQRVFDLRPKLQDE